MISMLRRHLLFCSVILLLIIASLVGTRLLMVRADVQPRVTLAGQVVPQIQQAPLLHATSANQTVQLSVGLQPRNSAEMDALLQQILDPQSPYYQHYLTPAQFTQRFAPTSSQVQQVTNYLQSQGLTVTTVAPDNLLIDATGSVAQVQQSFQVQINTYQIGSHVVSANANAPSIPASISPLITSISGLDTSSVYQPLYHKSTTSASIPALTANDLATAYDLTPLRNGGIQGKNQTLALFELDGYQQSDITQYFQSAQLPAPNISTTLVDGYSGAAGQGAVESTLDIELAGAIAPQASLLVYEGPATTQGMNDTYARIVSDHKAQIVSTSWGLCEASTGNAELQTLDTIFKQGALEGMSFIAASGDAGAYDCQNNALGVDSPADDPNVTAVGATTLQTNANGGYGSETVWSNPTSTLHGPHGAGSGGGLSSYFSIPSWQNTASVHTPYSNGKRQVPDITASGDPTNGDTIYCTVTNAGCPNAGWMKVGGTSAAAPFWAASLLLVRQYMQNGPNSPFGLVNPTLYRLFTTTQPYAPFHDITSGNNLYYPAATGYDLASGIGSPDIYNIARDLAPATVPVSTAPTSSPTNPALPAQLLQNGGFENGGTGWQETSGMGLELVDATNAHSGRQSAFLCGYSGCKDQITQTFTVPANASNLQLSYWWYATSSTTTACVDFFTSQLLTSAGATIATLQQSCDTSANSSWQQATFTITSSLTNYAGTPVTLAFVGTNAQTQSASFFVDDVTLVAS